MQGMNKSPEEMITWSEAKNHSLSLRMVVNCQEMPWTWVVNKRVENPMDVWNIMYNAISIAVHKVFLKNSCLSH